MPDDVVVGMPAEGDERERERERLLERRIQ